MMGGAFIAVGNLLTFKIPDLVPEENWSGAVTFSAFVVSLGVGIASYSLLHVETSLKEFRNGKEPGNRAAAGLLSIGLGMMLFTESHLSAAYHIGFTPRILETLGILLPLSILLIVAGLFRRPRFLFGSEETEWSSSRRSTVGTAILVTGFLIQVVTFIYGYWKSLNVLMVAWVWFLLIGPLVVILGIAILWGPMGRPWIPGSHGTQNEGVE